MLLEKQLGKRCLVFVCLLQVSMGFVLFLFWKLSFFLFEVSDVAICSAAPASVLGPSNLPRRKESQFLFVQDTLRL